jgi:hypothetical protein
VNEHIFKIKQNLLQLGFLQSFVDCLRFNHLYPDDKYSRIVEEIIDKNGIKLGHLNISCAPEKNTRYISFCFAESQVFIQNISITTYNKERLYTYCCVEFDLDFNFLYFSLFDNLYMKAEQLKYPYNMDIWFYFDINLDLLKFNIQGYSDIGQNLFCIEKNKENFLPTSDELLLIEFLQYQYNPAIVAYVPEFYIPSAYDFNSDEFKIRIDLTKMITI